MLQDTTFQNELRCTYEDYRQTVLDTTTMFAYMDSLAAVVHNAQARHFQRWPLLGHNGPDWELEPIPDTYEAELVTLKNWISERLEWLDANIPGVCIPTGISEANSSDMINCFPNPASSQITVAYSLPSAMDVSVRICNNLGSEVLSLPLKKESAGQHSLEIDTSMLDSGVYILKLEMGKDVVTRKITVLN
jgi:hypothetical protein